MRWGANSNNYSVCVCCVHACLYVHMCIVQPCIFACACGYVHVFVRVLHVGVNDINNDINTLINILAMVASIKK